MTNILRKLAVIGVISLLWLQSCVRGFPAAHFPEAELAEEQLSDYIIAYCWQDPNGRQSRTTPEDKEVVIVVSSADSKKRIVIRHALNLPSKYLSDFVIYKNGCVELGDSFLMYAGYTLNWRPNTDELVYTEGSDRSLTDLNSRVLASNFTAINSDFVKWVDGYRNYFWIPRGIYWSSDGDKLAVLGRDVSLPSSSGDNIWVLGGNKSYFKRVTNFNRAGDFIANAAWSGDGSMLAVEYRKQSGIGIIPLNEDSRVKSYANVTSETFEELSDYWPYAFTSWLQLIYDSKNIDFNSYISISSPPVWVNNDEQIIFAASDSEDRGTLFIVNSDGSGLEPFLPDIPGLIFMPRLSTDGRTLAFVRYPGWKSRSQVEIATIDIVTREVNSLVVLSARDNNSTLFISGMNWSPDGKYLMFSSNHAGESDIYIMTSDGESWRNITAEIDGNVAGPIWKP